MMQDLTAFRNIDPIRRSIHRRIGGPIFFVLISILLTGCPPWKISSVVVNPQPVAGNETVVPVVLVAGASYQDSVRQNVVVEVEFERHPQFIDPILWDVTLGYYNASTHRPLVSGEGYVGPVSGWYTGTINSDASRSSATILICDCYRAEIDGFEKVMLKIYDATGRAGEIPQRGASIYQGSPILRLYGPTSARVELTMQVHSRAVNVTKGLGGNEDPVIFWAAKALEITCLRDRPTGATTEPGNRPGRTPPERPVGDGQERP